LPSRAAYMITILTIKDIWIPLNQNKGMSALEFLSTVNKDKTSAKKKKLL